MRLSSGKPTGARLRDFLKGAISQAGSGIGALLRSRRLARNGVHDHGAQNSKRDTVESAPDEEADDKHCPGGLPRGKLVHAAKHGARERHDRC